MFSLSPFYVFSPDAMHPAGGGTPPARGGEIEFGMLNSEFGI